MPQHAFPTGLPSLCVEKKPGGDRAVHKHVVFDNVAVPEMNQNRSEHGAADLVENIGCNPLPPFSVVEVDAGNPAILIRFDVVEIVPHDPISHFGRIAPHIDCAHILELSLQDVVYFIVFNGVVIAENGDGIVRFVVDMAVSYRVPHPVDADGGAVGFSKVGVMVQFAIDDLVVSGGKVDARTAVNNDAALACVVDPAILDRTVFSGLAVPCGVFVLVGLDVSHMALNRGSRELMDGTFRPAFHPLPHNDAEGSEPAHSQVVEYDVFGILHVNSHTAPIFERNAFEPDMSRVFDGNERFFKKGH